MPANAARFRYIANSGQLILSLSESASSDLAPVGGAICIDPPRMSYTSLRYHIVFSTKGRAPMIQEAWMENLHGFLGGCINTLGGVSLRVGGIEDHVHLFARLNPTHRVSDALREIKSVSSQWVHREIGERRFDWQDGYSAFSVSASAGDRVIAYIDGQREHHRKRTFQEELEAMLKANGIPYDPRYI